MCLCGFDSKAIRNFQKEKAVIIYNHISLNAYVQRAYM